LWLLLWVFLQACKEFARILTYPMDPRPFCGCCFFIQQLTQAASQHERLFFVCIIRSELFKSGANRKQRSSLFHDTFSSLPSMADWNKNHHERHRSSRTQERLGRLLLMYSTNLKFYSRIKKNLTQTDDEVKSLCLWGQH